MFINIFAFTFTYFFFKLKKEENRFVSNSKKNLNCPKLMRATLCVDATTLHKFSKLHFTVARWKANQALFPHLVRHYTALHTGVINKQRVLFALSCKVSSTQPSRSLITPFFSKVYPVSGLSAVGAAHTPLTLAKGHLFSQFSRRF